MIGTEGFEVFFQREMAHPKDWDELVQVDLDSDRRPVPVEIRRVAVLMPNWLSEFIIALSVVTRKATASKYEFSLIVPERFVALCKKLSPLPVIPYNRKNSLQFLDSAALVKEASIDKLFLLPHSFSSAYFAFKTGVPICRGISAEQRNQFLTENVSSEVVTKTQHLSKEYSAVLETDYEEPSLWPGVSIEPHPHYAGYVVLCPGSGEVTRRWTGFEELVKLWPDQNFAILGDDADVKAARPVGRRLPHRVINLTGQTTLDDAAEIIAGASVVIANDSGLMQIAGYLGTPVVAIFGGSSPAWRKPLGSSARVITSSDSPCQFCFKRECARHNFDCLESVLPEDVIAPAMDIMRK